MKGTLRRVRLVAAMLAIGACVSIASRALAQAASASPRLPGNANAIMLVDVSKLLQSQLAREMEWQSKLIKGYADRPLSVPPTAKRMTIAAGLNPAGMQAIWQAAIVELPNPPRFDPILKAQGGYLDNIGGKNAAWTQKDVFFVELAPNTLGIVRPGQRQFVTRWITGKNQPELSAYLKAAQTAAASADAVFAIDLDEMVGTLAIRHAFGMGQLASLESLDQERDKLIPALASVRGVTLTMHVKDRITAEFSADFDQDVAALGAQAKPFVIDVLQLMDLYEPMVDAWEFKAAGKKITGQGAMQPDALNRLLALLSPARVDDTNTIAEAAAPETRPGTTPPAGDPQKQKADASLRYYKEISKILDSISSKPSPTQSATWLLSKSRVIEQLPILNVDPALLEWGSAVSIALKKGAEELALGQQKAMIASQGVATPVAVGIVAPITGGITGDTPETRAAFKNAQQERRRVSQAERGAAAERAFAIFNELMGTRAKIRADMVQKYGVEF